MVFQKKVHKNRHNSPLDKIVPIAYPVPKSIDLAALDRKNQISPIKYSAVKDFTSYTQKEYLTPAMQEYLSAKKFSEKLEHKKTENIESFFIVLFMQEKFKIVSKKLSGKILEKTEEEQEKVLRKEIEEVSTEENLSKMMKKLQEVDFSISKRLEVEKVADGEATEDLPLTSRHKSIEISRTLQSKFTVLNRKANNFINSLPSQTSISNLDLSALEDFYHNSIQAKLPPIKKPDFFDPRPLPANFKVNKNLMTLF